MVAARFQPGSCSRLTAMTRMNQATRAEIRKDPGRGHELAIGEGGPQ